jgi:lysyl-tRNA synthetase class 2
MQVETPVLEAVAGGADARPFVTFHNTLQRNFTLRIATELHLKRMVVRGVKHREGLGVGVGVQTPLTCATCCCA